MTRIFPESLDQLCVQVVQSESPVSQRITWSGRGVGRHDECCPRLARTFTFRTDDTMETHRRPRSINYHTTPLSAE